MAEYLDDFNNLDETPDFRTRLLRARRTIITRLDQEEADNNWYRAVVLEVGENELSVIYADYGNTEKVPFSRVLPIPVHLLQLPFQITRCTLTGREHFPAEFPDEVQQMFQNLLSNGVLATVQSFNGSVNVLSLTLPTEKGGGHLTTMILDALQAQAKSKPCPSSTQRADQADSSTTTNSSTATASSTVVPDCPVPMSIPETQKGLEYPAATTTPEPVPQTPQQKKNTSAVSVNEDPVQKIIEQMEPPCNIAKNNDAQTAGCCCQNLKTKIDHLEQLVQLQLSLIMQLVGQTK